jgi:energy-coupling factor transporter ATP-binding protein EcfA2
MGFQKVESIVPFKENNPFLLSWLSGGKEIEILVQKKKGQPAEIYFSKNNKELLDRSNWKLSESTVFREKGKKIFLKGDSRLLRFGNENYADKMVELLNEEESGFLSITLKPHYFNSYRKSNRKEMEINSDRKLKEVKGWKIVTEFRNENLGNYLAHLFSSPSLRVRKGRIGFNYPVVAWWEVHQFIPTKTYLSDRKGIRIGSTNNRGDIFLDFRKNPHTLISGMSGAGKSSMAVGLMTYILKNRIGKVIVIDPHGDTAKKMKENGAKKFIISPDSPNSINAIRGSEGCGITYRIAEDFVSILKSSREMQYSDPMVGPRMEDLISRGISLLTGIKGMTLVDFYNILKDKEMREKIYSSSNDSDLRKFLGEIGSMTREEKVGTERAIGRLVNDPIIRSLICNPEDNGILEQAISDADLIILDLERSSIGYEDSRLLSNIFALYIWFAISSVRNGDYFLFLEEGQDYQSNFIADMLSSGRKFGLHVFFITTSFKAISDRIESLLFSNVSNYIFMKMTDPDKISIGQFFGRDLDLPKESLDFLFVNSYLVERGRIEPVEFSPQTKEFKIRDFNFITERRDNELSMEIDSILSEMERCGSVFFIFEEFVRFFGAYEKSEVISLLKKRINGKSNIHYAGRMTISSGNFKGRHECFEIVGNGVDGCSLPIEFKITSDLISNELRKK